MLLVGGGFAGAHPASTLAKPYTGSVGQSSSTQSVLECAKVKIATARWTPRAGTIDESVAADSRACAQSLGTVGLTSSADGTDTLLLAIPFGVATSGSHSVETTLNIDLQNVRNQTMGLCPAKNLSFPPPLYVTESAYCEDGVSVQFFVNLTVVDLTGPPIPGNQSYVTAYDDLLWENVTDCYNPGLPGCTNSTSATAYVGAVGLKASGAGVLTWNGSTTLELWTNGSLMNAQDRFAVVGTVSVSAGSYIEQSGLRTRWAAAASDSIGLKATVGSISIG